MSDDPVLALRDLSQPASGQPDRPERNSGVLSSGAGWFQLEMTDGGAPIPQGTLVGFRTSQTVYVGHVESEETTGNRQRLRVRVDHWLALQDVSSIQKVWSQDQPAD